MFLILFYRYVKKCVEKDFHTIKHNYLIILYQKQFLFCFNFEYRFALQETTYNQKTSTFTGKDYDCLFRNWKENDSQKDVFHTEEDIPTRLNIV